MDGPTRPQGESSKEVAEVDYIQRITRSLTDSSKSPAQSTDQNSGMGSSSYSFNESYGRSPGLNPWGFFAPPGPVAESSEPSWRADLSPIQREILADFPWLNEELVASTSVVASKEESDACTSVPGGSLEQTPTDQAAWAQSMLELHAFENSSRPAELQSSPVRFLDQALSGSGTPADSETPFHSESLSSSLSDGEDELKQTRSRNAGSESGTEAAGTSGAQSGKRKRPAEQENGEDAPSDDQETSKKKPINRPRKKGGPKRVREPRYAIKTRTDTEVMDDGYKWRKYGQKAVKNSPHPRNYYRCTTPNCPVRKRVERCFDDPGLVVTTYEGTHTHQSPSFLRGPPGYPGGLQGLLATLSHHYNLAGNAPLPPFLTPLQSSSPLWLSQLQVPPIQENLNLLQAHEQVLRLQSTTSMKREPGSFPLIPGQGPSFSSVSSLSDLGYDTRMSHYDSLANASIPEQLGTSQITPFEYSSGLISTTAPFSSPVVPDPSSTAASSDSGLLEDMFRQTNPSFSRA